ncbi:MAG: SiaC family regulatory phosphoprotein, partial [Bacteroidota bacterium]
MNENYLNTRKKSQQEESCFEVPKTKRTPEVLFDLNKGVFKIAGTSQPYDVNKFYFPLMRKIDHYLDSPCKQTHLIFNLDEIDFSSSQFILAIIYR